MASPLLYDPRHRFAVNERIQVMCTSLRAEMKKKPATLLGTLALLTALVGEAHAEGEEPRTRSWCDSHGAFLYDDPGNTFPAQQCTWRARREAEFFQDCIDQAPRPRHARRWLDFARDCGFEISNRCVPGAVAVSRNGRFGHVGVCTADLGDGRFRIVDMNNDGATRGACRDGEAVWTALYQFILPPTPASDEAPARAPTTVVAERTPAEASEARPSREIDPAEVAAEAAPDGTLTLASAD